MSARPFERCLWALSVAGLTACVPAPTEYLDDSLDAWTVAAVDEASPLVNAFVGVAGIVAEVCPMTEADWDAADEDGVVLSQEALDWFGFESSGSVSQSESRGDFLLSLTGGVGLGGESVAISIEAVSPTQTFEVSLYTVSDEIRDAFSVSFTTSNCDAASPVLLPALTVQANTLSGQALEVSAQDEDAAWTHQGGAFLPTSGTITWTGEVDGTRIKLLTSDASLIDQGLWPIALESSTWSTETDLVLD